MDVLRDWLAPTIHYELSEALRWKEGGVGQEQPTGERGAVYSDDGSNLRVKSSKKDGVVQIGKFLTFEEPIQAYLCDKRTQIIARLGLSATREYEKQYRKSFTKDKTGGLIQILDCEIVATHLGPTSDRLTLLVNKFKSLGSDGSGAFSEPRPIDSNDKGCYALLKKLRLIRTQEKAMSSQEPTSRESSATASSFHSQAGVTGSGNLSPGNSQQAFATQVPLSRDVHTNRQPNGLEVGESGGESADMLETPEVSLRSKDPIKSLIPDAANVSSFSKTNPSGPSADLLRLLDQKHQVKQTVLTKPIVGRPEHTPSSAAEDTAEPAVQSQPKVVPNERVESFIRKDPILTSRNIPATQDAGPPKQVSRLVTNGSENDLAEANVAIPESIQRSSKRRKLSDRISSRDVRIHKDQEILLNRPDSWLPAEPNRRKPQANIPIALLQILNSAADHRDEISKKPKEKLVDVVAPTEGDQMHCTQEWESESEVALDLWPPSPNRGELPPDSSPPVKNHSDSQSEPPEPGESPSPGFHLTGLQPNAAADGLCPSRGNEVTSENRLMTRLQSEGKMSAIENIDFHASTPDSDIEMAIPVPLQQSAQSHVNIASRDAFPSTVSQSKQPFTQVMRTPYVNGHVLDVPNRQVHRRRIPVFGEEDNLPDGTLDDSNVHGSSTASTFVSRSDSHPIASNLVSNGDEDHSNTEFPAPSAVDGAASNQPVSYVHERSPGGSGFEYKAVDGGSILDVAQRDEVLSNCVALPSITLRKGSVVSLIRPVDEDLVNGIVGEVVAFMDEKVFDNRHEDDNVVFQGLKATETHKQMARSTKKTQQMLSQNTPGDTSQKWPVVRFTMPDGSSRNLLCQPESWKIELPDVGAQVSRIQLPLIHSPSSHFQVKDPDKSMAELFVDQYAQVLSQDPLLPKRVLQADEESADGGRDAKRKKQKPSFFYPSRSSRRGNHQIPPALDVLYIPENTTDPAISARQHRQDWFAARRSSGISAAKQSPISPPKGCATSTSNTTDRDEKGSFDLAILGHANNLKTAEEIMIVNRMSTSVTETAADPSGANGLQKSAQELCIETELGSALVRQDVPDSPTTTDAFDSINVRVPMVTDSAIVFRDQAKSPAAYERDEFGGDAPTVTQLGECEPTRETLSLKNRMPRIEDPNVSLRLVALDTDSSVPALRLEKRDAVSEQHPEFKATPTTSFAAALEVKPTLTFQSLFEKFKTTYADYVGDIKHFLTLCKKIETLWKFDRLHRYMWDDFLIRHKLDYAHYVQKCVDDGDNPIPYEKLYNDEIDEPKYCQRILTPHNLECILYGDGPRPVLSRDTSVASTPLATSSASIKPPSVGKVSMVPKSAAKSTLMIDLTDEDAMEISSPSKWSNVRSNTPVQPKPRRLLPWTAATEPGTLSTPASPVHNLKAQRQPSGPSSQRPVHAATHERTAYHLTKILEMESREVLRSVAVPSTSRRENHFTDLKGKGKESRANAMSSKPRKGPLLEPGTEVRPLGQDQTNHLSWWQDQDAPFKIFAKSYIAIQPGHGNSFARPEDVACGEREDRGRVRKLRHLDVLGWKLG